MKITIIGAGIGGLTTAIALKQKGHTVEIFETSAGFTKAGSGINLAINAMQVYKRLGIYDGIENAGSYSDAMIVADSDLKEISKIDLKISEHKYGVKTVAIHRATLHKILLGHLKGTPIHLNKKLKSLTQSNNQVDLVFEDGTTHTAAIVIGADGIYSAVRKSIFNNTTLRIAKQVCWRGITKIVISDKYQTELNELWGRGKRFGFVQITKEEVYWYALANYNEDYKKEYETVELENLFEDFNPMIGKIIKSTNKNDIITNEMMDLKPIPKWYYKNVCLVGDAAHATTPNMGQGACQAIESAYVLAQCLSDEQEVKKAFETFEKIRKKKAVGVVNDSWRVGKIAHWKNDLGIKLRNSAMRIIPKKLLQKQSTAIFELNY